MLFSGKKFEKGCFMKCRFLCYLSVCLVMVIASLQALPGRIKDHDKVTQIPIVSLESLDLKSYTILRKFNPQEHIPEANWKEHGEYFLHRNRTVYLTADQKFAVKIWEEQYPSSRNFLRAVHAHFYTGVAKLEGLVFDEDGNCRGYITPYMISRTFRREEWDSSRFFLEKNALGVSIFGCYESQPQNYKYFFNRLVKNVQKTGILCTDFCPNNVVVEQMTGKIYLVDLEDVLEMKDVSTADSTTQMLLEYNPRDYLKLLNLLS
jgi:hypothetical protein